jgi:IS5 family transposase
LSDEQILKDIEDRKSFKFFLDYPEKLPCSSTLGNFRDRLNDYLMIDEIWFQHQQQLALMGHPITKELAIDAAFLDANPGSYKKPRGELAQTCRSKDGTHMTKNKEHHFGFKTHVSIDLKFQLIRTFKVTTAAVHDSQITFDFIKKFIMYADKGYIGADFKCYKAYMLRKSNNPQVNALRILRNLRISRKRAPVERIFAVFKEHSQNQTKLTTTPRNQVKILFASLLYNIKQIITLQKEKTPQKKLDPENNYETLFNLLENTPQMIENRKKAEYMKKQRIKRIKKTWKKYFSIFKRFKSVKKI